MNIEDLVTQYTKLAIENQGCSDEELLSGLCSLGLPADQALEAVRFIPIAFARHFLDGMGITFSERYWVFSPAGKEVSSGSLTSNPIFHMASELAPKLLTKPAIEQIVFRSAEANSVNQALNSGSKSQNLQLAPVVLFTGTPTAMGLELAQSKISSFLRNELAKEPIVQAKKSWWRIWQ
jgi:hypothetical protein